MAPFYLKEGEKRVEWDGEPKVLKDKYGNDLNVTMIPTHEDTEQAMILVDDGRKSGCVAYVRGEPFSSGGIIFPGSEDTFSGGFKVVDAWTGKTLAKVTHREKRVRKK